jgi:hypothetical protein
MYRGSVPRPGPKARSHTIRWCSLSARAACLATAVALLGPLTARSAFPQTIRGVLLEQGSGRPIVGAFIVLLDEEGGRPGRDIGTLTDDDGRFTLRVPRPGRYRLRAERIGFKSTVGEVIEVAAGATVGVTIAAPVEAVRLDALRVTGESECGVPPERGRETVEIWEEARKALRVLDWAAARQILRYQVLRYERELSPGKLEVREEWTRLWFWNARGSLFVTRPPGELAEQGYIRQTPADTFVYYAPDAAVVLSESFSGQHCFAVQEGRGDRAGLIGLGFEPAPGRDLPDIEGVLWLDKETAELRDLEYRYTHLPLGMAFDDVGGLIVFERLPSGVWIVSRWWIRMPMVEYCNRFRGPASGICLAGLDEEGGIVIDMRTAGGEPVQRWLGTKLTGVVFDSTRAEPLAGATVFLVGTERAAQTDAEGRFEFDGLVEGEYSVGLSYPALESLAFAPEPVQVVVERDRATEVQLALPPADSILESLCGRRGRREGRGAVVGFVSDSTSGAPVAGVTVTVTAHRFSLESRTDRFGRYTACSVPPEGAVAVVAQREEQVGAEVELNLASGRIQRADLEIGPPATMVDPARSAGLVWFHDRMATELGHFITREEI